MILHNPTKIFFLNYDTYLNVFTVANEDLLNPISSSIDQTDLYTLFKTTGIKFITQLDYAELFYKELCLQFGKI